MTSRKDKKTKGCVNAETAVGCFIPVTPTLRRHSPLLLSAAPGGTGRYFFTEVRGGDCVAHAEYQGWE